MTEIRIRRNDLMLGTGLAIVMGTLFARLGGKPLLVTFLPGLAISWLLLGWLCLRGVALPARDRFAPIYFTLIAWQGLHLAEEFVTGFYLHFPQLYDTAPYSQNLFVCFNMAAYFVFSIGCLLTLGPGPRFLLVPVLFFLVYGAVGNAVTHTWWVLLRGEYFPGFWTAQAYWVLGPLALSRLLGSWRASLVTLALTAAVLIPCVTLFISSR
jgi:hypothetical protein